MTMTQIGDIYHRAAWDDHWLITDVDVFPHGVYRFRILNLEKGLTDHYTSPFGGELANSGPFKKVA